MDWTKQSVYDALEDGLPSGVTLAEFMAHVEREVLRATIATHGGTMTDLASQIGLTREGLFKKRKRFGLPARRTQEPKPIPADQRERLEAAKR